MVEIDGIIYNLQRHGGISVYFNELISTLETSEWNFRLSLYGQRSLATYSVRENIIVKPRRLLERYRPAPVSHGARLFHSSYYRVPDRKTGLRTVVTVHDFVYERYAKGVRRHVHCVQKHKAIRNADALICVSKSTARDLEKFVGRVRGTVHVIPNGVSPDFFTTGSMVRNLGIDNDYVLFVGGRRGYKNFRLAADAMKLLPDMSLVCVGGEPFEARDWCDLPSGLRSRIVALRNVSNQELNSLYNNARCLVYPSLYEGFGIPVVEAMRAGCPVVVVKCEAVMEVGGSAVTVCEELAPEALAESIKYVGSSERGNIIDRGLLRAKQYSWAKTHQHTLDLYRQLLD